MLTVIATGCCVNGCVFSCATCLFSKLFTESTYSTTYMTRTLFCHKLEGKKNTQQNLHTECASPEHKRLVSFLQAGGLRQ